MSKKELLLQKIALLRAREKFPLFVMAVCALVICWALSPVGLYLAMGGELENFSDELKNLISWGRILLVTAIFVLLGASSYYLRVKEKKSEWIKEFQKLEPSKTVCPRCVKELTRQPSFKLCPYCGGKLVSE